MRLLFPSNAILPNAVDSSFEAEAAAAAAAGLDISLVDLEAFPGGSVKLRNLPPGNGPVLYRGWILDLEAYQRMVEAVEARGYRLVTDLASCRHCYHLPEWYEAVGGAEHTPRSFWLPGKQWDLDAVAAAVGRAFGTSTASSVRV